MLCVLPDKNQHCNACAYKRKKCLWYGKGILKSSVKKDEGKEVEATEGMRRRPKRPLRTIKARMPSQRVIRVESSEEVEEAVMESRKRRKIEVRKEVEENSGGMLVSAMCEEAPPLARQGV